VEGLANFPPALDRIVTLLGDDQNRGVWFFRGLVGERLVLTARCSHGHAANIDQVA
jgi:hypothetical protein